MKRFLMALMFVSLAFCGGITAYAQDGDQPAEQQPAVESADDQEQSASEALSNIAPFETWQMISGVFVAGFVVPIVNKRRYSNEVRTGIALLVALVTALVGSFLRGELDNFNYTAATVMQMAGIVYLSYQTIWKAKFLNAVPQNIEARVLP